MFPFQTAYAVAKLWRKFFAHKGKGTRKTLTLCGRT